MQLQNSPAARSAVDKGNGFKLDKEHTMRVNLLSDFEKFATLSAEYRTPEIPPLKKTVLLSERNRVSLNSSLGLGKLAKRNSG